MKNKSSGIINNNQILQGFSPQQYIVRSQSSKYGTVSILANNNISCEKDCIGYSSRNISSHTLAVSMFTNTTGLYLNAFAKKYSRNLTKLTVTNVNSDAGRKSLTRKQGHSKSPDMVKRSASITNTATTTIGDLMATSPIPGYEVSHVSKSGLKLRLQSNASKGNTSKPAKLAARCGRILKEGPDDLIKHSLDEQVWLRHRETDYVYLAQYNYWKKTLSNKHYHVMEQCVLERNPSFKFKEVEVQVVITEDMKNFIGDRFN